MSIHDQFSSDLSPMPNWSYIVLHQCRKLLPNDRTMKCLKRTLLLASIIFAPLLLWSQTDTQTVSPASWKSLLQHDTAYIQRVSTDFVIGIKSLNWQDVYTLRAYNARLDMKSDLSCDIGLSCGYKILQLTYSVNINDLLLGQKIQRSVFRINLASNIVSAELLYTENRGQTQITRYKYNKETKTLTMPFSGLSSNTLELDIYYYANNKRYSNSAAYTDSHFYTQSQSAGSFITGISYSQQYLQLDFSDLSSEDRFSAVHQLNKLNNSFQTYCISAGYGHNFIFDKVWLANISVIPSAGIMIDRDGGTSYHRFAMRSKTKIALIYSLPKHFIGINCKYSTTYYHADDYSLDNSIGAFNLLAGLRF